MTSDWGSIADWVTATVAVIYTLGTFLLWWTTRRSLDAMRDAFKLNLLIAIHEIKLSGSGSAGLTVPLINPFVQAQRSLQMLRRVFPEEYESLIGNVTPKEPVNQK